VHCPPALQPSASFGSQATQAAPFAPHSATLRVSHVVPLQQPVVQVCEHPAQALFWQVQTVLQAAPPEPHAPV
jgi:hypothetical protein